MILMARMHSKKHGKSRSRKPMAEDAKMPELGKEQIIEIAVKYAKEGKAPAEIGELLKKEHKVLYIKHALGKSLVKALQEKGITTQIPYDLLDLMKKAVNIHAHLSKNAQDFGNKMKLQRTESKIWRLTKYYIREGQLPAGWRYDPKRAELIIKRTQ